MLPAEHILDLYCFRLSNADPFYENYTTLNFNAKNLEKGLNRGLGKIFGALFSKKVPFLANIEWSPKLLEYTLTRGVSR